MPQQVTYTETYWTVCWAWIFPYPCKKEKRVTKWCYDFTWVIENRYFFFSYLQGCESGIKYSWYAFSFGLFGQEIYYNVRLCFDNILQPNGKCG